MELKISDVLDRAAEKIEPEGAWTQRFWARDEGGGGVASSNETARCWCLIGAICAVDVEGDRERAFQAVRRVVGTTGLARWNDSPKRAQAQVVAALREAARREREAGR